jgi:hypothetical protein
MKMQAFRRIGLRATLVLTAALAAWGCGQGGSPATPTMQDPTLGVSLQAPAGWQVRSTEPGMATKGDSTGIILEEPMHGRVFEDFVTELTTEFGAEVISRDSIQVNGHEAIQEVIEFPNAGSKALKVYIHKPPNLVEVSFVTPQEDFAREEAAIRAAIQSISLR